jgi:hypothetical protein
MSVKIQARQVQGRHGSVINQALRSAGWTQYLPFVMFRATAQEVLVVDNDADLETKLYEFADKLNPDEVIEISFPVNRDEQYK